MVAWRTILLLLRRIINSQQANVMHFERSSQMPSHFSPRFLQKNLLRFTCLHSIALDVTLAKMLDSRQQNRWRSLRELRTSANKGACRRLSIMQVRSCERAQSPRFLQEMGVSDHMFSLGCHSSELRQVSLFPLYSPPPITRRAKKLILS